MKNLITLKGSIGIAILFLMVFTSCKKEKIISKKSTSLSESHKNPTSYNFTSVVKIYGDNPGNGFLSLTVSSNDDMYLKKYVKMLEQTAITFKERDPSSQEKPNPILIEKSESDVFLSFDWSNYHPTLEKGKIYGVLLTVKNDNKALVYYNSLTNCSGFSSTSGYAAVNVYTTYSYLNHNSSWSFSNTAHSLFYQKLLSPSDNLEVRTFTYTPVFGNIYSYFTLSGTTVYYRPRINYVSPEMPSIYTDYNSIGYGQGLDNSNGSTAGSTVTFYLAG